MDHVTLTPELLLNAYANGVFPMAENAEDEAVFWVDPKERGIIPLNGFHISRSLARVIKSERFRITLNNDFTGVVDGCADRKETWINPTIYDLYGQLHALGFAHSLEVYEEDTLVGGVYGVSLGTAFFGESMFSRATNASKIALAYMVALLNHQGFTLFDTQFLTPHLASLGAVEISRKAYHLKLADAMETAADITADTGPLTPQFVLQVNGQTS